MPRASEETLEQVILLHQQGLSHRQIQSQTGVPKSTVSRVIHRWITTGSVSRFKPGRDSPYTFSSSSSSTTVSLSSSPSSLPSSGFLASSSFSPSSILSVSSPISAPLSANTQTNLSRSFPYHDKRLNGLINSNTGRRSQSPSVDAMLSSGPTDIYEAAVLLMNLDSSCSRRLQSFSFSQSSIDFEANGEGESDDRDGGDGGDDEERDDDVEEDQWGKEEENFSNSFSFPKEFKLVRS